MFFSTYVLTRKGPLAKVWLAAHWDRRLTRNEVKVVDLSQTIVHIVHPVVPIALRTSGELLVGVVRIYALKVRHLLKEATEATLFLRVTTTTGKSQNSNKGNTFTHVGPDGVEKSTTIEGVLVGNKGDVEAVTFDLGGKAGGLPEAEALAEARFDAIADLLHGKSSGNFDGNQAGQMPNAWYAIEPTSQPMEELHNTQQDYDEIAKMRADLTAFGERTSESGSKSKSSLSSIEKPRGSLAGDVPYPPVHDEFDIGVPLPPEELPSGLPMGQMDGFLPEDPFAVPEMLPADQTRVPAVKRTRPVNVLDLAATILPRQTIEKSMEDRSDILNAEPRRGPLNEEEERDRYTIVGASNPTDPVLNMLPQNNISADLISLMDAAPLSSLPSNTLRVMYATVLQQNVAEAVEEAIQVSQQRMSHNQNNNNYNYGDMPAGGMPEDELMLPNNNTTEPSYRREKEEEGPKGLSINAVKVLERIRDEVSRHAQSPASRKRGRESSVELSKLVGKSCLFREITADMRRREAAKAFVDVLALASKQMVNARQSSKTQEVEITLREECKSVLV